MAEAKTGEDHLRSLRDGRAVRDLRPFLPHLRLARYRRAGPEDAGI